MFLLRSFGQMPEIGSCFSIISQSIAVILTIANMILVIRCKILLIFEVILTELENLF